MSKSDSDKSDPRKNYILRVASHIFGLNLTEDKLPNIKSVHKFCETSEPVLIIARHKQRGNVELSNELDEEQSSLPRVVFYKSSAVPLTTDNYRAVVSVLTMRGQPAETLLASIQQVFSKPLQNSGKSKTDTQLVSLVSELEESLMARLDSNKRSTDGISSLPDEIRYWKRRRELRHDDEVAMQYCEAFAPLDERLEMIDGCPLGEFTGFIEAAEDCIDALWRSVEPYPETRMKQLIHIIGGMLVERVASEIGKVNFWKSESASDLLQMGISLCDQWTFTIKTLTQQSWKRNADAKWKGDTPKLDFINGFRTRLNQILSLRMLSFQVGQLLDEQNVGNEIQDALESSMKSFDALIYNPFTESQWKSRLQAAERSMEPIIEKTIPVLKNRFQPSRIDSSLVVSDLVKYKHFLNRPRVKERLIAERETLLSRLLESMSIGRREFNERLTNGDVPMGRYLTEIAAKIIWIRQQIAQVENTKTLSEELLNELNAYPSLKSRIDSTLEEMRSAETEHFDSWCREIIEAIDEQCGSIALQTTGKLMTIEKKYGTLIVNYSDRLVKLLKEVRQLGGLGFIIPSKIINCANVAEKFYKYAIVLKQVAHFYNTIEQQMLPCQQAMMLDEALTFEKLIIAGKKGDAAIAAVTWDNPEKLQEFIEKLQEAAQRLTIRNRKLRKAHSEICEKVVGLMNLDLLKEVDRWKDIMLEIRAKFVEQEPYAGSKSNMRPWLVHWDRQLYKALDLQYRWGIENLHAQIPQIQAELVFKEQRLQLRPSIEEIRAKYYREMKKFLSIPQKFRGVQDTEQANRIYAVMIERNANRFHSVYEKAEQLFDKLSGVDAQFEDWIVLGQVDLEQLIDEKFTRAADWEAQIKLLKGRGREAEKLPSEIKLECILVTTSAVKNAIDDMLQRLFDTLIWTLRHSINAQIQTISQFLSQAITVLSSRPHSIDEIAEANRKHMEFGEAKKEMKEMMSVIDEKNRLLRSIGGSGAEQMPATMQQWEKFELMLDSHQIMIKEQVDVLKSNVGKSIKILAEQAEKLFARWNQFKPNKETLSEGRAAMLSAIEFIKEERVQFDDLQASREKLMSECEQFAVEKPEFAIIDEMEADLKEFENNWILYERFNEELQKLTNEDWIVFRSKTYLFDEFLHQWTEKLKSLPASHMTVRIAKDIDGFKEMSGGLKYCRGEMLSSDHWLELFRLLGMPKGTTLERLHFGDLLTVHENIAANIEALKNLNARAQGEVTIREAIQEVELWAAQAEFTLTEYKHTNGSIIKVIKDWKDSINSVKDTEALLQSLKNSPFYAQFTDKTSIWETRLADLDQYLQWMNEIQRKWIYLEPIFGRGSLPSEASRFNRVDVEFRTILNEVARDSRLVSLCSRQYLRRTLEQIIDQLNRCQRALNQFLEEKRSAFPRFYFLGDDDLLEILGQSTNPVVIQAHLKKLFQGISKVVFGEANQTLVAIVSAHGERVQLSKPVRIVPQVEIWLQELSIEMKNTIRLLTIDCLRQASLDPGKYPSQVLCLAEQIRFCRDCENALDETRDLKQFQSELKQQLAAYTSSRVEDLVLSLKLKSLILDLIHHINIVDELLKENARDSSCWFWQKQLRFYLETSAQHIVIRQVNAKFDYTYEYQGNATKLVHTPLTDKCYLTLTQAMSMGVGGNPYGPAGTGKTESVKALGNLFARQVLVFNCDEGIDVHSMSRIFVGLVQCGAWGCFDEFNRLDQTVLSAVSMQVQTIQNAIKSRSGMCSLGDKEVSVDPNSAIFITLNPAGRGYGGRQKLPDNLKQLFRPVAMSVPDNELIAETILYSEGFKEAKVLARKLVTIFDLSREMLSQQQHYDWGLRALKTVLRGCGDMLTANPTGDETQIVVEALQLNTLSKLTFGDSSRFDVLIGDVFTDVKKDTAQFDDLAEALKQASEEMKITITDIQKRKIFELYEQLRRRMGVVLVGPSGCGKSTLWRVLKRALAIVDKPVTTYTLNPKSISRTKLLGYMDLDTREWFDGVLTAAAREVVKDSSVDAWIVCDGDIDPEWVEALNSVLDDNRLLTMPSGERIKFGANVNFLFETDDLSCASPATISRMGMIFMSEEDVDAREIVKAWLKEEEDAHVDMQQWIDDHLYRCLKWIWDKDEYEIKVSRTATVHSALCHLRGVRSREEFLVAVYRGLSPNLSQEARDSFAQEVVFSGITLPDPRSPSNVCYDSQLGSIISYTDDTTINITLEQMQHEERRPYILTAAAQANRDTVCSWLRNDNRHPFIVFGPDGCGKESLLRYCFQTDPNSQVAVLHCSAQTSAEHLLQVLARHCVQVSGTSGRVLKPKEKANLIVYLKALNLVKPDEWGTCELVAFLQQVLTYRGYYDEKLEWIGLENIQLVASMSLADGAGKHHLATRFTSLMRICSVDCPPEQSLVAIYCAYLTPILQASIQLATRIDNTANIMVRIFEDIRSSFKQTDKAHYIFTPKDLTNWSVAMIRYDFSGENAVGDLDKCLIYESQRIFRDRLVNNDHIQRFDEIIVNVFSSANVHDTAVYIASPGTLQGSSLTGKSLSMIPRKEYAEQLQKAIGRYESEVAVFKLPLFDELITLCAHIDRIITRPGGCALLAGKSGMGRRAAASLVANIHQMKIFTPRISSSYGIKQFKNELKTVMQCAAVDAEHVVFIMEDYQILSALFLQSINSVLSSGDLPGLFTPQEFDSFSASLRDQASQDAYEGDLHSYFAYKVKRNMHIILIMDIDGADFAANCDANPSLYKECAVIWKDTWNRETLFQIPRMVLDRHSLQPSDDVVACFAQMFDVCPTSVASPAKFSAFVDNYVNIFNTKRVTVESRLNRLKAGVRKLTEAREAVAMMQEKAAKKSKLLAEKQAEADMALKAITQSMTGANEQKADMEQLKMAAEKENERIEQQKKIIDEQLREVEPMLNEAREAVGSIKSESLSEIRSLRAPPEAIRDILQAVLLFMGILDTSWEAMRKFLAKSGVKEEIINFDARRITPEVSRKVTTLMKSKAASFDPKNAKRASAAAAPLAAWVRANLQYSSILEKISPLEQEKNELMRNLGKAEKQMAKLSKGLRTVDEKVADLKANFEVLMKDATQIKIDLDKEQATIQVAGTLVERLGGEFERWQQQMSMLQEELDQLERCSVLTAAFVTFLGSASEQLRKATMDDWRKLTNVDEFNALRFASMETEQLNWKNKGLPSDVLSVENAMIIFNSVQVPLLIDPSGRVSSFLENYLKESKVEKLNAAQPDFITQVELGVRFGKSLIVDDVVYIDPALMKLLRMELSSKGPRHVVQIGDKTLDYNIDFRIFFCTKNGQIDLPRCMKSAVTEVNFTTTRSGLASQMLGFAIKIEKPELESRSSELTRSVEEMKMKLDELEQTLLQALASSEGSLLDNAQLLDSLNKSKENAETISASLQEADKLREELNEQRDVYLPLAQSASTLYFAINELHRHNHMYNFSVNTVINLFKKTLTNSKNRSNSTLHLDELKRVLQSAVFEYVSRSLFKEDRLMFSMNFIHATQANLFLKNEWEIFTGLIVDEPREDPSIKNIAWIDSERKAAVAKLQSHLPTLYNNLRLDDQGTWSEFSRSTNCEAAFPQAVEPVITLFQKVIVIQAVRPDRLHSAMTLFATRALGIPSINPPPLDLKSIFRNESNEFEPILIMTGAGADPSQDLEELARSEIGCNRFYAISMGQGQQQTAIGTLRRAAENGDWVCLKNLHLVIASIPAIQKELSLLQRHSSFRLWLTSEQDDKFPSVLLQDSIKLTFESPPGVKNNMNRTYTQWRDSGVSGGMIRLQCLFVLAWMHALIQERRTFIPQAWSKFYEFNNADLRAAKLIVEEMTSVESSVPEWEFIRGLMQYVIYGGRIDNPFDFDVLNGYLLRYFNSSMISAPGAELAKNLAIPRSNKFEDYVMAIEKDVPAEDAPSLFGLPDNIRISWEVTESEATIRRIRNMQIGSGVEVTFEWMRWKDALNPILNMWKRLNSQSTLHSMPLPHANNSDDPMVEVLSLEFVFAVALVQTVHRSLSGISKCLRGVLLPSSSTMKLAQSLILHETPDAWQDVWTGPSDPVQYLTSLMYKAKATQELVATAKNGQLLSSAVKLSKLFRPGALLNALRQLTARRKKKSMDELKLATAWNSALLKDEVAMQLSGIYIQGALFENTLADTLASSPPFSSVPKLSVAWISTGSSDVYKWTDSIFVPMYASVNRQQLITQVQIPCGKDRQKWQIASVALFLSSR